MRNIYAQDDDDRPAKKVRYAPPQAGGVRVPVGGGQPMIPKPSPQLPPLDRKPFPGEFLPLPGEPNPSGPIFRIPRDFPPYDGMPDSSFELGGGEPLQSAPLDPAEYEAAINEKDMRGDVTGVQPDLPPDISMLLQEMLRRHGQPVR